MEDKKSWDEWVESVAAEYGLDLEKSKITEKQKRILDAAIQVFAEKGYSGTSTSEIAERAGVAEATIFKHYRTKKGLLLRLVIPAFAKVASPIIYKGVVQLLDQDKPMQEIMKDVILDRVQLVERHGQIFRVILVESLFHPELREALIDHVFRNVYTIASQKITELQQKGKLRQDLPEHVIIRGVIGSAFSYLIARNIVPQYLAQGTEEEEVAWTAEILMHGLAAKPDSGE
ncbi:TetR/AcrR family transcriptional regulator [Laceyella putida]|uniref:TetR/AcrR family transcriptional regulator n=1 Tax=Laceyella putida TaxID=110101 RepID=A0ABW2RLU2_9BACL